MLSVASSRLSGLNAHLSLQRVLAGLVFIPLLAYSFKPFGDMQLSFSLRLLFWTGVLALALTVTWAARKMLQERLSDAAVFTRDVIYAVVILALFAPSLWLLGWLIFTCSGLTAPNLASVLPYGAIFATGLLLVRQGDRVTEEETQQQPVPRLYSRLPETFSGQVFRLAVRDHCVDVVTSEGVFTIRSRFTDAIAEMEPVEGHCAHRSHWVVDSAIEGTEKQGGKTFLRLSNGDLVPISRKYRPGLEQAGLI